MQFNHNNRYYLLLLNRMRGVGPVTVHKLLRRWPVLHELFQLSIADLERAGLSVPLVRALQHPDVSSVEMDLRWEEGLGRRLITWGDLDYPRLLAELSDAPPVLYAEGTLDCLIMPSLAIVGTRNPTVSGAEIARSFGQELAKHGMTIVSGLARGIDAYAHEGALLGGGPTVAVMGTGIDCIYPREHARLAEKIAANGLLLSEFSLKSPPMAGHFPRRNRIISGLSMATLVVESAIKSGSLVTARYAMEQNRDVFAIPGSIRNPYAQGCHQLLKQGALLVTSVQDVLDEMRCVANILDKQRMAPSVSMAGDRPSIMQYIGCDMVTVDALISRTGLGLDAVVCELTELELSGVVQSTPGGYMRCQ